MKSKIILVVLLLVMTGSASAGFKMYGQGGQYVESPGSVDSAQASTPKQDIHREYLETYGLALGRAAGCRMNTTSEFERVKQWIANNYSGDEHTKATLLFVETFNNNFKAQLNGQTPDTCEDMQRVYGTVPWP